MLLKYFNNNSLIFNSLILIIQTDILEKLKKIILQQKSA